MRGPAVLPGPLTPRGVPDRTPREVFDAIVLGVVERLDERWHDELGLIEFAVEETPLVPDDWATDTVPLASLVPGGHGAPTRLVLFRKPIELRCETRTDLTALVQTVLVEQVSELLGIPPEEIDPGYEVD
jgi:predicted Zn-dependent protease with MMP-like domain